MLHSTSVSSMCFKFKIKSDFKVHIKAKHKRQLIMNCFNMDLEIRFNFEFGNTQRTLVELCLPHLSQETTLKMQKELSENESKDFIDSIKDSRKSWRIQLRMSMLVMLKQNLMSSRLLARSNLKLLIITSLDLILKGFIKNIIYCQNIA